MTAWIEHSAMMFSEFESMASTTSSHPVRFHRQGRSFSTKLFRFVHETPVLAENMRMR